MFNSYVADLQQIKRTTGEEKKLPARIQLFERFI